MRSFHLQTVKKVIETYINDREGPTEALCFHPQQVLQLRDHHVHRSSCSEASHQGLCKVDRHKAKPEKTESKLREKEVRG